MPARSPIRSFVTSNRQFTMREFFQFIHSAVTAVFYLGSTSLQTPPLSSPPHPHLLRHPRPRLLSGNVGLQGSEPRACADTAVHSCLSQPARDAEVKTLVQGETRRRSDSSAFNRGSGERRRGAFGGGGGGTRRQLRAPRRRSWPCNEGRRVEQGKRRQMKELRQRLFATRLRDEGAKGLNGRA